MIRIFLATLALLVAGPALAQTATGHFTHDGVSIDVSHAIAYAQDNAEGLLDHGPQVRVLLSDRVVPVSALYGVAFPPVRAMARDGEVRGLLLEFNPADRNSLEVTVLSKPEEPGQFAPNISMTNSAGLWKTLTATATRISGEFKPDDDLAFAFDAVLVTDPVQADLKGPDAQKSEQVRVLLARAEAIGKGDLTAAAALSSKSSANDLRAMPPAMLKEVSGAAAGMIKEIRAIKRVVVRRDTAVAIMGEGSWSSLVREDGVWKVAD